MPSAWTVERLQSRLDRSGGPSRCWPWLGASSKGYGQIAVGGRFHRRRIYAHHLALVLSLGRPLDAGKIACHHCDNPPCCNPAHLYEGTAQTNADDMVARGRTGARRRSRPDTTMRLRLLNAERRGDGLLADGVDWDWWREQDEASARDEVAAYVARRERGEIDGRCHWLDPLMSFVPAARAS